MDSSSQLTIAYDMLYYVKFTAQNDSRLRFQLKTCDSIDSDSTTLAVTAVVAASYL